MKIVNVTLGQLHHALVEVFGEQYPVKMAILVMQKLYGMDIEIEDEKVAKLINETIIAVAQNNQYGHLIH